MQDNWFKLEKKNDAPLKNVDYDKFTNFLEMSIGKMKLPKDMKVKHFNINLNKSKFDSIIQNAKNQMYNPIISFHATNDIDSVSSIIKNGYVLPGDINIEKGIPQSMRIGAVYGPGVYTSCDLNNVRNYTVFDGKIMMYFVVNIVMLGNIEQIAPNDPYHYNNQNMDTTILYGMKTIISRNPINVIPIGSIVTSCNLTDGSLYLNNNNSLHQLQTMTCETNETITFTKLMNDYYVVPKQSENSQIMSALNYIILPSHFLKSKLMIDTFDNFIKSIQNPIVIIYDHSKAITINNKFKTSAISCVSCGTLQELSTKYTFSKIPDDLSLILDNLMEMVNANNTYLNLLYFFFNNMYDGQSIKDICNSWQTGIQDNNIIVKSVYVNKMNYENEVIRDTFYLRCLDTISHQIYKSIDKYGTNTVWDRFLFECSVGASVKCDDDKLNLSSLLSIFIEDYKNMNIRNMVDHHIPYPLGTYGYGFLMDLTTLPSWSTKTDTSMIFKGVPPKYINVDGIIKKVIINDIIGSDTVNNLIECCIRLLAKFKNTIIIDPYLYDYYNKTLNGFLNDLSLVIDTSINNGRNIPQIKYLYNYIQNMKNDMNLYGNVKGGLKFDGSFFARLKNLKFSKRILKRINHHVDNDVIRGHKSNDKDIESIFTKHDDIKGYACQMINTNASEIEPWLIIIKKVSHVELSIADVYKYREFGILPSATIGFNWNGILIMKSSNVSNKETEIIRAFNAYQYTDNPYLILPNQKLALLTSSCVSILERILINIKICKRKNQIINENEILAQLNIFIDITKSIKYHDQKYGDLLVDLMNDPYATLRDKQKVPSLTVILGMINYYGNDIKHIYRAIFMESLYRTIETCMKMGKFDKFAVLTKIFMPTSSGTPFINMFFQNRFISTTPFAIVSYLEFIKYRNSGLSILDIATNYANHQVSVIGFFKKYFDDILKTNTDLNKLQLALVLISIDKIKLDENVCFDSDVIIQKYKMETDIALKQIHDLQKLNEERKLNEKNKRELRRIDRINKYIENNKGYVNPHCGIPKIFTKQEVSDMNMQRRKNDYYELMDNGLLKHHCCYPNCPDYLGKSFATDDDIKTGTKRKGLFNNHFKINIVLDNYYKGVHREAKKLYIRKLPKEMFHEKMYDIITKNIQNNKNVHKQQIDKINNDINYVISKVYDSFYESK